MVSGFTSSCCGMRPSYHPLLTLTNSPLVPGTLLLLPHYVVLSLAHTQQALRSLVAMTSLVTWSTSTASWGCALSTTCCGTHSRAGSTCCSTGGSRDSRVRGREGGKGVGGKGREAGREGETGPGRGRDSGKEKSSPDLTGVCLGPFVSFNMLAAFCVLLLTLTMCCRCTYAPCLPPSPHVVRSGPELASAVESSLRAVNLWNNRVADKQARQYSGGMKRRLSVAISFMGNPLVVYLDEPSTVRGHMGREEGQGLSLREHKQGGKRGFLTGLGVNHRSSHLVLVCPLTQPLSSFITTTGSGPRLPTQPVGCCQEQQGRPRHCAHHPQHGGGGDAV